MIASRFPRTGADKDEVLGALAELQSLDVRWADGRAWALVYPANEAVLEVARAAASVAAPTNALSGRAFRSLAQIERDLVAMTGELLGLARACGHVTSGGSESIFLAMKSARDRARSLGVPEPLRVVAAGSAHPAFDKAAHYLGMETTRVPVASDQKADPSGIEAGVDEHTAMVVASAPSYPYGVVDPIPAIAEVARRRDVWLHVDACVGGFLLPFVHALRGTVPPFDFSVDGVASMSADLHKYGFAMKGASVVLYRNDELQRHQPFRTEAWGGGEYRTPNLTGTRSGAPMASAWAVIHYLGWSGYCRLVGEALAATDELVRRIRNMSGLDVPVEPIATLFAFTAQSCDLARLTERMMMRGWYMGLQGPPPSVHLTVSPGHFPVVDAFIAELSAAVGEVVSGADTTAVPARARYGD